MTQSVSPSDRTPGADSIWWHVYPLGACGAPIHDGDRTQVPRLRMLINWLDYAVDLGATGLLLGPIFDSATHGYDTLDYLCIDPRLGSVEDFDALVEACHAHGMNIMLDGVFSHVSDQYPPLRAVLEAGKDPVSGTPNSPDAPLFHIDWESDGGPYPWFFEGNPDLVRFDHTNARVKDFVQQVMEYWCARGIDGWRLDAAYSVPTEFWADVCDRVRASYPGTFFLGEVIHGDYPAFVGDAHVDTVTQYELWKAMWSSITDKNFFELDWTLKRHGKFLETFVPQTFVGNHDTTRISSLLGADGGLVAQAIIMTLGGTPSIYYGDEQGFTGVKEDRQFGDDAVRPPLPVSPGELLGFGHTTYQALRSLVWLRRKRPWLTRALTTTVAVTNTSYSYRSCALGDDSTFVDVQLSIDEAGTAHALILDEGGHTLWQK